jgi:MFS family permease
VIVTISFVTGTFASGAFFWAPSVLVVPMQRELGWSLTEFFVAFTVRAVLASVLMPLTGPWLDGPRSARYLAVVSALALAVSLAGVGMIGRIAWLGFVPDVVQFYFVYGVLGAIAWQGSGYVLGTTIVPKWFVLKRGRAMGIAAVGTGFGPALFPPLTQALIDGSGWRGAWLGLSVLSLVILVPLMLLVRTRPEDVGLLPDGRDAPAASDRSPAAAEQNLSREESMRTLVFWLIALAVFVAGVGIQGFQPHWVPYLVENDFSTTVAVLGISVYGFSSSGARFLWGLLAERYSVRWLLVVETALTGASIFLLIYVSSEVMVIAFMVAAGLSMGGFFILQPLLIAEYFGRAHLGAVSSAINPALTFAGAFAPVLVAALRDGLGNYVAAFFLMMVTWYAASVIFAVSRSPQADRRRV